MTTTSPSSQPTRTDPVAPAPSRQPRVGWLSLLVAAGWATIASFVIAMIIAGSIEAFFLAMAVPIVVGLLVVWRWRRAGIVVLGVVLLAELLSSAPFLADALAHPETPGDFLPLTLFAVATLVGGVAAVPAFREARNPGRPTTRSAMLVAVAAVVILVAATAVSIIAAGRVDSVTAQPGDIELTTADFRFDAPSVTAGAGTVAVTVTNDDATRHTFTVDELGVDLNVPPGTTQRVTFPADPGTYRFYCIPHAPDMAGELTVR
ncbi:MAG TPA: cupredoxin domain-containing protein [Euzebyales bacterium]